MLSKSHFAKSHIEALTVESIDYSLYLQIKAQSQSRRMFVFP